MRKRSSWPEVAVFAFLLPNLIGFLVFTLFPLLLSLGMAFTNWSLKPGQETDLIGLRNFLDLLGVRALPGAAPHPWCAALYYAAALMVLASLVGLLWARLSGWAGGKWSSAAILVLGLAMFGVGAVSRPLCQPLLAAGVVAVALGAFLLAKDEEDGWDLARGAWPGGGLILGGALLAGLHTSMWSAYEARDPRFWSYLYNTLFMMLGMPFSILGSLGLALLVSKEFPELTRNRKVAAGLGCLGAGMACMAALWASGYPNVAVLALFFWCIAALGLAFNVVSFRTIFYLPTFTSGVALMVLWKALYNPDSGPINQMLHALLGTPMEELPKWLVSNTWAKPALVFMGVWTGIGGSGMLLYLSALSGVPVELTEAAAVDGADAWDRFRHVTWPSVAPTTFFILVMSIIGGLQGGFEQARVMTGGQYETTTLSYYIFNKGFQELDLGYGAATAWILFAMIFIATAINWRFGKEIGE